MPPLQGRLGQQQTLPIPSFCLPHLFLPTPTAPLPHYYSSSHHLGGHGLCHTLPATLFPHTFIYHHCPFYTTKSILSGSLILGLCPDSHPLPGPATGTTCLSHPPCSFPYMGLSPHALHIAIHAFHHPAIHLRHLPPENATQTLYICHCPAADPMLVAIINPSNSFGTVWSGCCFLDGYSFFATVMV